jgi:glycosyltransferase involved in cell wall biosynthesis
VKILLVPNDPLVAYPDLDRWVDRPNGYVERGHEVVIFPTGELPFNAMPRVIRKYGIDIVRTLEGGRWVLSALAAHACASAGAKLAISVHGELEELALVRKYSVDELQKMRKYRKVAQETAGAIMVVQKSYERYLQETKFAGKVHFLPNYVRLDIFKECANYENTHILYVGRLDSVDKDVPTMLNCAKLLDMKFTFVGSGPMENEVRHQGHTILQASNNDIPGLMSQSQIVISAMKGITGFSIPTMEAQACSRPVIVCRKGYTKGFLAEWEPDEDVAYFMDPDYRVDCTRCLADKIEIIMEDGNEWNRLSMEGRARMEENFDRDKILDKEVKIIEETGNT